MSYRIEVITGENHDWRGVAFLISDDRKVNAYRFYSGLNVKHVIRRSFNTRFDQWRDGQPPKKHRYHGWNKPEFKNCFVFKYKRNRLYGFLCNPKSSNPRYQLCVLIEHATKNEFESDETNLKYVEEMGANIAVQSKVETYFKERK